MSSRLRVYKLSYLCQKMYDDEKFAQLIHALYSPILFHGDTVSTNFTLQYAYDDRFSGPVYRINIDDSCDRYPSQSAQLSRVLLCHITKNDMNDRVRFNGARVAIPKFLCRMLGLSDSNAVALI